MHATCRHMLPVPFATCGGGYIYTQLCMYTALYSAVAALLQLCCSVHMWWRQCVCVNIYTWYCILSVVPISGTASYTRTQLVSHEQTHTHAHTQLVSISGTASYGSVAAYSRRFTLAQVCMCSVAAVACSVECSVATYSRLVTLAQM